MIPAPKQWDEQYLRECAEDEIELARLLKLGKFAIPVGLSKDSVLVPAPSRGGGFLRSAGAARLTFAPSGELPRWRRDWIAAGDLSTELGLSIRHDPEDRTVSAGTGNRRRDVTERYQDHPSKSAATWTAIVRAAIQELEALARL